MPLVPAFLGEVVHVLNRGRFRFKPKGDVMFFRIANGSAEAAEELDNPAKLYGGSGLAARLLIGLNVGDKPTHSIDDIVTAVGEIYRGSASFIAQKGIYVDDHDHKTYEDSVQVVIISDASDETAFKKAMVALGEKLAAKFQQKEIVLEIQKKGIVDSVYGVTPKQPPKKAKKS